MSENNHVQSRGLTLAEARAIVHAAREDGLRCPCCDQFAKVYRRKLNASMARGLIWLVSAYEATQTWVHVARVGPQWLVSKGGTLATVAHWGLIVEHPNDDEAKRTSGLWMPTEQGVDFAYGRTRVASHVYLYNNEPLRFEGSLLIRDALGKRFNYAELMQSA